MQATGEHRKDPIYRSVVRDLGINPEARQPRWNFKKADADARRLIAQKKKVKR